jgi:hypothetical protein
MKAIGIGVGCLALASSATPGAPPHEDKEIWAVLFDPHCARESWKGAIIQASFGAIWRIPVELRQ